MHVCASCGAGTAGKEGGNLKQAPGSGLGAEPKAGLDLMTPRS